MERGQMEKDTDVLLEFCRNSWDEVRHLEDQRVVIANLVILVSTAIVGLAMTREVSDELFPLSLLLLLVGVYGLAATAKLYERYLFELSRFSHLTARLGELHPGAQLLELRGAADSDHGAKRLLMARVPLNQIWLCLHWGVVAVAVGLAIINWPWSR